MRSSLKAPMRKSPQAQSRRYDPDFKAFFRSVPGLYLVLSPDFEIVSANDAYLNATYKKNEEISGRRMFDVFPDNPNVSDVHAVGNLRSSLEQVLHSGLPHLMRLQRYDVTAENHGCEQWVEKYWSPGNFPLFAPKSREITYIIHRVEDMTPLVRLGRIPYLEGLLNDTLDVHTVLASDVSKHQGWLNAAEENLFALTMNLEASSDENFNEIDNTLTLLEMRAMAVLKMLEWQKPYYDALHTKNPSQLGVRIRRAEWAIAWRSQELQVLPIENPTERNHLRRAKATLRELRNRYGIGPELNRNSVR